MDQSFEQHLLMIMAEGGGVRAPLSLTESYTVDMVRTPGVRYASADEISAFARGVDAANADRALDARPRRINAELQMRIRARLADVEESSLAVKLDIGTDEDVARVKAALADTRVLRERADAIRADQSLDFKDDASWVPPPMPKKKGKKDG